MFKTLIINFFFSKFVSMFCHFFLYFFNSAGYIYLECVTKVGTYCNLDVGRALINVNKMLSQYGCVNDSGKYM